MSADLKNKIFEAINTGIQNALVIDGESSVNYTRTDTTNQLSMLENLVQIFKDEPIYDNFLNITKYVQANKNETYKVQDIYELDDLWTKINMFAGYNKKIDNIYWIDTYNALTVISDNDIEYAINDINNILN